MSLVVIDPNWRSASEGPAVVIEELVMLEPMALRSDPHWFRRLDPSSLPRSGEARDSQ
jgi:hypothetical protein